MDAPPPAFMQIEPVGQCNLRCRMCPIQFRRDGPPHGPPAFMAFEVFKRLIEQAPALRELHLQGLGEPLMHPQFFEMVEFSTARGIRVSTNTNMTLLSRARAERCVTSGLDSMHISIDGATPETYEGIRVRANFRRVLKNLLRLMDARRRLGNGRRPQVRLIMVAMRRNLHELPDVVRLAARFGISSVFVQHLCHDFAEESLPSHYRPMRDFVQSETLLEENAGRIERFFGEARRIAEKVNLDLRLPGTRPVAHDKATPGPERCGWPWNGPYVSYQGLAMPCCMVSTPDRIHFGDMGEKGVESVWNNEAYRAFREKLSSDAPPEICRTCSVYLRTF